MNDKVLKAFDRIKTYCQGENGYPYNQYLNSHIPMNEDLKVIEEFIKDTLSIDD